MAAAVTFSKKVSLGGGTYLYIGQVVVSGGSYATGGEAATVAAGERFISATTSGLPERVDYIEVSNFAAAELTGVTTTSVNGKLKLFVQNALKVAGAQVENAANVNGTYPFYMIGS